MTPYEKIVLYVLVQMWKTLMYSSKRTPTEEEIGMLSSINGVLQSGVISK